MSDSSSPVVPRRSRFSCLRVLAAVAAIVAFVVIAWVVYWKYFAWPPFVSAGDSMGIVIEREGLLPDQATWRSSIKARTVRVFGVADSIEQDRVVERVRREMRFRGKPHGFDSLEIEFWSGEPPPPDQNLWEEKSREDSAVVRTVEVP